MSIQVRNIQPSNSEKDVSINSEISFDLVAMDGSYIDISSLIVGLECTSNIDADVHRANYDLATYPSGEGVFMVVPGKGLRDGELPTDEVFYKVILKPDRPFDENMMVTIKIDVSDTLAQPMGQFSSSFVTIQKELISEFRSIFIDAAQCIPIHNEVLKKDSSSDPRVFDSAFKNWNRLPSPRIMINQVIIHEAYDTYRYTIDYENGRVIFEEPLDYNDEISADYTFSYFTDEQINGFFKQATSLYYMNPPMGGPQSIYNNSPMISTALMVGAAMFAMRQLMFALIFQEKRIIFDNASWNDGWTQIKDIVRGLSDLYKDNWDKILEAKKLKLPAMSMVIVPEFTLPSGRSRYFRQLYKGGAM